MATTRITEQVLSKGEFAGVVVLVTCSMLSLISVLGVLAILGVSAVQRSRSPDKPVFVRTQVAKYLISLLICNISQAVGGILNIPWAVANRIYVGVACTAQGAFKQIGNTGPAIFTFVIAVHTFCLLFLRCKWSDRTCNIILVVSWAYLLLELSTENFFLPKRGRGPYYGITTSGYWCWISPTYEIERYVTDYLYMTASAAFSAILYSLVFFRLRGNISVSGGYKISFHRRPGVRIGRTSDGTFVVTGDRRVESYLTTVAKHMLWYPAVYIFLVLPLAATRFSTFRGYPVPAFATFIVAGWFMLHGFVNTILFSATRSILPGGWKQRFGLSTLRGGRRGDTGQSVPTSTRPRFTGVSAGTVNAVPHLGPFCEVVDIKHEVESSNDKSGSLTLSMLPTLPTLPTSQASTSSPISFTSPTSLSHGSGWF